jgi:hypothetical protein
MGHDDARIRTAPPLHVTLNCTVPLHTYLMAGTPSIDCSTVEPRPFHATTNAGLMQCAQADWHAARASSSATLDGRSLEPAGAFVATRAFGFKMPANENLLRAPGHTSGLAAVVGYVAMLRPLRRGRHTLTVELDYKGVAADRVTYHLTVG